MPFSRLQLPFDIHQPLLLEEDSLRVFLPGEPYRDHGGDESSGTNLSLSYLLIPASVRIRYSV
jgi:hypothetical protein